MSRDALPCIACGRSLCNVEPDLTNQPYCGTSFESHGHYGSTAYDPMDGHYLEINVCDLCLVLNADRVLEGRDFRPVIENGVQVGTEELERPWKLVPWRIEPEALDHVVGSARDEFGLAIGDGKWTEDAG